MPDPSAVIDPVTVITELLTQAPVAVISVLIVWFGWRLRTKSADSEVNWLRENFYRGEK